MNVITIWFLGAFLVANTTSELSWTEKDSWFRKPPEQIRDLKWDNIDPLAVYEVSEQNEAEAELLLKNISYIKLTQKQAKALSSKKLSQAKNATPYLVRGLYLNRATGGFFVKKTGKNLWAHHRSLGHQAVPMKRQALVVLLEEMPQEVFVTCSMAE